MQNIQKGMCFETTKWFGNLQTKQNPFKDEVCPGYEYQVLITLFNNWLSNIKIFAFIYFLFFQWRGIRGWNIELTLVHDTKIKAYQFDPKV